MVLIIKLYHGTLAQYAQDIVRNGINLDIGNMYTDFGKGFYTTPDLDLAINTAKNKLKFDKPTDYRNHKYAVVVFELEDDKFNELNCKLFFENDDEWARFVIANRCKNSAVREGRFNHNQNRQYDLVVGPTADGKYGWLGVLSSDVSEGRIDLASITSKDVPVSNSKDWGKQWSFHTEKSVSCLKLEDVVYYEGKEVSA